MYVVIIRNNVRHLVPLTSVRSNDLKLTTAGRFLPASSLPGFPSNLHPQRAPQTETGDGLGTSLVKLLLVVGLAWLAAKTFESAPQPRRKKVLRRNVEPLSAGLRAYIRERDEEICTYCGCYAPEGHVDHRVSRANGGSNRVNNLSWSCAPCNQSKGSMSARQFTRYL
jgi:5-methylcytosine-specific restriction endonuclease McrA